MVSGGAHQGRGIVGLAGSDQLEAGDHRARGQHRRLVGEGRGVGVWIKHVELLARCLGHPFDVAGGMICGQIVIAGRFAFGKEKEAGLFLPGQGLVDGGKALRAFHMVVARVVLKKERVFQDRCFSAHTVVLPTLMVRVSVMR
jgi:hypothetical protein